MAAEVIEAYAGADRWLEAQLEPGSYTAMMPLAAQCWPGDDLAVLFEPSVTWLDPSAGQVLVGIHADQTAGLPPATYPIRLGISTEDGLTTAWVPLLSLRLRPSPGTRVARAVYCSYDDLRVHAGGWLDSLFSQSDAACAGAAEERGSARAELEAVLLARWAGDRAWLSEQLGAGRLIVTEPIRRWNVLWSLYLVCRRQIAAKSGHGDDPYRRLASDYRAEADALLATLAVELDLDADGVADLSLPMGTIRALRA